MSVTAKMATIVFLIVGVAAAAVGAARNFALTLRVAALPATPETAGSLQSLGRVLAEENRWIRLERVQVANATEAVAALAARRVDLAILRSDMSFPAEARTIAITRREKVFLIAPPKSTIESFRDLRNQKVGLLRSNDANVLDLLLEFYGVPRASVARMDIPLSESGPAILQKRVVAVLAIGSPDHGAASEAFTAVSRSVRGLPSLIGVDEAESVAERMPAFKSGEIAIGAFQGRAPEEAVTTVTIAHHLVAHRGMTNIVAGELARMLMASKARLQGDTLISGVEASDTEQRSYAIHPGAKAYFDDEQTGLFDRFQNLFWVGSALIGIAGSALAWIVGKIRGRRDDETCGFGRLTRFFEEVHEADHAKLDELRIGLDTLVAQVIAGRRSGEIGADEIGAYQLAIDCVRDAIRDRRNALV
jgi:TRAP-type uncharacterized transport system substrate-binding protein